MPATKPRQPRTQPTPSDKATHPELPVLTRAEAAAFLRIPEAAVLDMVQQQGLPGRCIGQEWRFSRAALEVWLVTPHPPLRFEPSSLIGAWKDDPYLEEMLADIYRQRGRPLAESDR